TSAPGGSITTPSGTRSRRSCSHPATTSRCTSRPRPGPGRRPNLRPPRDDPRRGAAGRRPLPTLMESGPAPATGPRHALLTAGHMSGASTSGSGGGAMTGNPQPGAGEVARRRLGKPGERVPILGDGGPHHGDFATLDEAARLVHEAIDAGATFFDNCWEYWNGRAEAWLGRALKGRRDKAFLMTKVCTH